MDTIYIQCKYMHMHIHTYMSVCKYSYMHVNIFTTRSLRWNTVNICVCAQTYTYVHTHMICTMYEVGPRLYVCTIPTMYGVSCRPLWVQSFMYPPIACMAKSEINIITCLLCVCVYVCVMNHGRFRNKYDWCIHVFMYVWRMCLICHYAWDSLRRHLIEYTCTYIHMYVCM